MFKTVAQFSYTTLFGLYGCFMFLSTSKASRASTIMTKGGNHFNQIHYFRKLAWTDLRPFSLQFLRVA
jgi:hypothetical protein